MAACGSWATGCSTDGAVAGLVLDVCGVGLDAAAGVAARAASVSGKGRASLRAARSSSVLARCIATSAALGGMSGRIEMLMSMTILPAMTEALGRRCVLVAETWLAQRDQDVAPMTPNLTVVVLTSVVSTAGLLTMPLAVRYHCTDRVVVLAVTARENVALGDVACEKRAVTAMGTVIGPAGGTVALNRAAGYPFGAVMVVAISVEDTSSMYAPVARSGLLVGAVPQRVGEIIAALQVMAVAIGIVSLVLRRIQRAALAVVTVAASGAGGGTGLAIATCTVAVSERPMPSVIL